VFDGRGGSGRPQPAGSPACSAPLPRRRVFFFVPVMSATDPGRQRPFALVPPNGVTVQQASSRRPAAAATVNRDAARSALRSTARRSRVEKSSRESDVDATQHLGVLRSAIMGALGEGKARLARVRSKSHWVVGNQVRLPASAVGTQKLWSVSADSKGQNGRQRRAPGATGTCKASFRRTRRPRTSDIGLLPTYWGPLPDHERRRGHPSASPGDGSAITRAGSPKQIATTISTERIVHASSNPRSAVHVRRSGRRRPRLLLKRTGPRLDQQAEDGPRRYPRSPPARNRTARRWSRRAWKPERAAGRAHIAAGASCLPAVPIVETAAAVDEAEFSGHRAASDPRGGLERYLRRLS